MESLSRSSEKSYSPNRLTSRPDAGGKGARGRYILFPASFRLVLKSHRQQRPEQRYLFGTRRGGPFTTRRIQQIVQRYREQAGLTQPGHPHLFRHQMLTFLTAKGLSDAQIQLTSGARKASRSTSICHWSRSKTLISMQCSR
jgi:site-specific recombinase XerD